MIPSDNPFSIKILLVFDTQDPPLPETHAVNRLKKDLQNAGVKIIHTIDKTDAIEVIAADPTIQCVLLHTSSDDIDEHKETLFFLTSVRKRTTNLPVFLMSGHAVASDIASDILDKVNDFIWIMEDTPDFIVGRILAAIERYRRYLLPPLFKALASFEKIHEYSWHTPGHTGGTAFLKSPVGRAFFNFFKEPVFRSDLSISVGELGSLLDHSGPIGESERYAAGVFGANRTYFVTNGSSTSNRIILMASVTRGQIALCDRNCHKSVEHAMTMSGAVPTYLIPSRNRYGIIGPIFPDQLTQENIRQSIQKNPLTQQSEDKNPVHAIITNSTYDGLCYNVVRVSELLGNSVDRLHFDEAWYGYARFNPLYKDRYAMCGNPNEYDPKCPTVFATQSTHKLLAAFSQASMIHIKYGRNPIHFDRFNESFMMHASTSPFYPIIVSNDISTAMMAGNSGKALTEDCIKEAVSFRKTISRLHAEYTSKKDWFFNVWQPETVPDSETGEPILFYEASEEQLISDPNCWTLKPNEEWHGFGNIEENYCLLDPIKVSLITPGIEETNGSLKTSGIPATVLTAYLDNKGIIVEKTADFTVLVLFSLGITKGKWGTLLNALFEFKKDYAENAPLKRVIPKLIQTDPMYDDMGLKDLCDALFKKMTELKITQALGDAFSTLPYPDLSPSAAYEALVRNNVESVTLDQIATRTVATGVVPYPPGIPLLMPGENIGEADGPVLRYLKALESFDRSFPGFTHDTHGVKIINGQYHILCLKKEK